jgi:hypothetical protein
MFDPGRLSPGSTDRFPGQGRPVKKRSFAFIHSFVPPFVKRPKGAGGKKKFIFVSTKGGPMQNLTNVLKVFDAVNIPANGNVLSQAIDVSLSGGNFSLQLQVAGNGTVKADRLLSNNGTDFLIAEGDTPILTGITKTSGPGSDGKVIDGFTANVTNYIKIKLTETGGANDATVTGWLAVQ